MKNTGLTEPRFEGQHYLLKCDLQERYTSGKEIVYVPLGTFYYKETETPANNDGSFNLYATSAATVITVQSPQYGGILSLINVIPHRWL